MSLTTTSVHPAATSAAGVTRINPTRWNSGFGYDQAQLRPAPRQLLTLAGQGPVDQDGHVLHVDDVGAQLALSLRNVEDLLAVAGLGLPDVLRLVVYATDVDATLAAWGVLLERLQPAGATPPATLLGVTRLALPGMSVELDVTAGR